MRSLSHQSPISSQHKISDIPPGIFSSPFVRAAYDIAHRTGHRADVLTPQAIEHELSQLTKLYEVSLTPDESKALTMLLHALGAVSRFKGSLFIAPQHRESGGQHSLHLATRIGYHFRSTGLFSFMDVPLRKSLLMAPLMHDVGEIAQEFFSADSFLRCHTPEVRIEASKLEEEILATFILRAVQCTVSNSPEQFIGAVKRFRDESRAGFVALQERGDVVPLRRSVNQLVASEPRLCGERETQLYKVLYQGWCLAEAPKKLPRSIMPLPVSYEVLHLAIKVLDAIDGASHFIRNTAVSPEIIEGKRHHTLGSLDRVEHDLYEHLHLPPAVLQNHLPTDLTPSHIFRRHVQYVMGYLINVAQCYVQSTSSTEQALLEQVTKSMLLMSARQFHHGPTRFALNEREVPLKHQRSMLQLKALVWSERYDAVVHAEALSMLRGCTAPKTTAHGMRQEVGAVVARDASIQSLVAIVHDIPTFLYSVARTKKRPILNS